MKPYIKDLQSGNIRPYGSNHHDSLLISQDGTYLTYEHLQCGDGSIAGDKENSGFVFCDDKGHTPEEDEILCRYGADAYFNIGGWEEPPKWIPMTARPMTEEEWEHYREWSDVDEAMIFDCELPEDGQEVLVSYGGYVCVDTFCKDDGCYFEGVDIDDVDAWMPLPKPYKSQEISYTVEQDLNEYTGNIEVIEKKY